MKNQILEFFVLSLKKYWIPSFLVSAQIFLVGSLLTFSPTDNSWFYHATGLQTYRNVFGFFGSHAAAWCFYFFGRAAFLMPILFLYGLFFYWFILVTKKISFKTEWDRSFGVVLGFLSSVIFCQLYNLRSYDFSHAGGSLGFYISSHFLINFDLLTAKIVIWILLLSAFVLITRCAYLPLFVYFFSILGYCCDRQKLPARLCILVYGFVKMVIMSILFCVKKGIDVFTGSTLKNLEVSIVEFEQEDNVDRNIEQVVQDLFWHDYIDTGDIAQKSTPAFSSWQSDNFNFDKNNEDDFLEDRQTLQQQKSVFHTMLDKQSKKNLQEQDMQAPAKLAGFTSEEKDVEQVDKKLRTRVYELPTVVARKIEQKFIQEKQDVLALQARVLEDKLQQFDIEGSVVAVHAGPVVTLFEYQPDIKVKVSRILALEDDLAMALKALSIRIIAPIPGRSVVGFEVANQQRQDVMMAGILQSQDFKKYPGMLPMIFGQDTLGNDVIADLAKMPHLLIAGSTGSGKSVALNAMLVSLLCSLKPTELKLIIIDPKRLEFAAYDGIAHLLFPIVTETKKAIPILKWVVKTMEERYEIMAKYGVRNLGDYQVAAQRNKEMEPMPFIVVIIDELADLMMTAGKAVEDSIARIAQMARAAGIHMIVATQRPSVDVITGMIKVNFPNRVAFKVTSKVDSRTILDVGGAEKLLGRGDMLFLDATKSHLVRVHGAYISDQEIHDVVAQITQQCKVQYLDISEQFDQSQSEELFDGDDELYQEILEFIQDLDEVSISMLQRRFRIGYNRSARIISILESKGLIMTVEGGKTRRVIK